MKSYLATVFLPPSVLTVLAQAQPILSNWEKAGIIGIMAVAIGWLARRDYIRDQAERKIRDELDKERLSVQKQLLQAHKENAAALQGMLIADFQAKHAQALATTELAGAMNNLAAKVNAAPCSAKTS